MKDVVKLVLKQLHARCVESQKQKKATTKACGTTEFYEPQLAMSASAKVRNQTISLANCVKSSKARKVSMRACGITEFYKVQLAMSALTKVQNQRPMLVNSVVS